MEQNDRSKVCSFLIVEESFFQIHTLYDRKQQQTKIVFNIPCKVTTNIFAFLVFKDGLPILSVLVACVALECRLRNILSKNVYPKPIVPSRITYMSLIL